MLFELEEIIRLRAFWFILIPFQHPSLPPDALSHLLDRCALAVEELSGVQAMVLQDAGQAVDTVDKVNDRISYIII